jgi:hypothetical protein
MPIYSFETEANYREIISFAGLRLIIEYRQWQNYGWSAYREGDNPEKRALAPTKAEVVGQWVLKNLSTSQSKILRKTKPMDDQMVELKAETDGKDEEEEMGGGHGCPHLMCWLPFPAALCYSCQYGKEGWVCVCGKINDYMKFNCTYCATGITYQWTEEEQQRFIRRVRADNL